MKKRSFKEISHGQLCLTDFQTRGRGQHQRDWETAEGENLTFTLAFVPSVSEPLHRLTLACARALVGQVADGCGCEASIKWPNDVYVEHKKVAGILTETVFNGNSLERLLIGIGINVNQGKFSEELRPKASSLKLMSGDVLNREAFLCELLSRIEHEYERWVNRSDQQLKSINQKLTGYGQWVRWQVNGNVLNDRYKLLGVNEKDQLTGVNKEGDIKTFSYEKVRIIAD